MTRALEAHLLHGFDVWPDEQIQARAVLTVCSQPDGLKDVRARARVLVRIERALAGTAARQRLYCTDDLGPISARDRLPNCSMIRA
jgi:hypothetical protein